MNWDIVRFTIFAILEILLFYYFVTRFISVVKFGVRTYRARSFKKDKKEESPPIKTDSI
ncbi:MAG: hypothetical protein V1716_03580 [Candidatus Uhrbacteria bacterium]